jgi:hypothetical protein
VFLGSSLEDRRPTITYIYIHSYTNVRLDFL